MYKLCMLYMIGLIIGWPCLTSERSRRNERHRSEVWKQCNFKNLELEAREDAAYNIHIAKDKQSFIQEYKKVFDTIVYRYSSKPFGDFDSFEIDTFIWCLQNKRKVDEKA